MTLMIQLCFIGQVPAQVSSKALEASKGTAFSNTVLPLQGSGHLTSVKQAVQLEEWNLNTITRTWGKTRTEGGPFPS